MLDEEEFKWYEDFFKDKDKLEQEIQKQAIIVKKAQVVEELEPISPILNVNVPDVTALNTPNSVSSKMSDPRNRQTSE
jgi:molybdopterin-biosynthesis enzyme MoeA-like protein